MRVVRKRASALRTLVFELADKGQFALAQVTADVIPRKEKHASALRHLACTLARAQRVLEAEATFAAAWAVTETIPDWKEYINALRLLTAVLAQVGFLQQHIELLGNSWRQARTRDEILSLFTVDVELLLAYPELGKEFRDSFAWVDAQLAAS